jgi:hypothetical protein
VTSCLLSRIKTIDVFPRVATRLHRGSQPSVPEGRVMRLQDTLFFAHEIHYFFREAAPKSVTDDRSGTGVFEFALYF